MTGAWEHRRGMGLDGELVYGAVPVRVGCRRPVPWGCRSLQIRGEDMGVETKKSFCRLCPAFCAVEVDVDGETQDFMIGPKPTAVTAKKRPVIDPRDWYLKKNFRK